MTRHVLVAVSSKYGATAEIAEAIGKRLRENGIDAAVLPIKEVNTVEGYDALVIGSAVYAGHWLKPARDFVEQHRQLLASRPVWLFSSGPIGDPPEPEDDPVDVAEITAATKAREHRLFAGKLDKSQLNFAEKAIVFALRAPAGDFRDWDQINEWATAIAASLVNEKVIS